MKQRVKQVAKKIFEKPATKLADRIIVGTPDIFNPVWEHAERFAESSYQTNDVTEKQIYRSRYLQHAPIAIERRTSRLFDALPFIGWMVRQLLQFADWNAIAENLYASALGYSEHLESFDEEESD